MAALTGESRPTPRISDAVPQTQAADARNCVFMGTSVVNGSGRAVVFATGLATEFGRIYRLTAEMPSEDSPLLREVTVMARRVAAVAIAAGMGLFAIRALASNDVAGSFVFALGVMVALVPEGLPATMSVSLAVAVRRMARRHALIKRLTAVEALGSTTVICTDKTGTLTKAEMTVQAVWESGREHGVTGVGYAPDGEVEEAGYAGDVLGDQYRQVEAEVADERERMCGVRGKRDEDRLHGVREVPGEEVPLGRVEIPDIQDRGPQVAQSRAQLLLDEPGHQLLLGPQLCAAGPEHLSMGQALRAASVLTPSDLPEQASDPLHRELVVDHAHDPGKLDPLQKRLLRVLGQGQHAAGEAEPAQLPVDKGRRRVWRDRYRL